MFRVVTMAVLLTVCLTVSQAWAQQNRIPKIEVAAGYARLKNVTVDRSFPGGVFVSIEGNYRPWFGVGVRHRRDAQRRPSG